MHYKGIALEDFSTAFAARLKEERGRMGHSQYAFGEIGGVGKLTQLKYEKGSRLPSAEYLARIVEAGADVGYLLTGIRSDNEGVDSILLAACIAAIDHAFSGSDADLAQFSALLYHSAYRLGGGHERLDELAQIMRSGWNISRRIIGGA